MLPIRDNTFTAESGYIYKYFTDEDIELIKSDEHIVDVLNAATAYPFIHSITVSKKLYEHLKYFLEITPIEHEYPRKHCHEHSYIYKHQEGFIDIIPNNNRDAVTIVIWVETGKDRPINNELYEEILSKGNIDRKGLQCLLDPNVGGSLSPMNLSVANLIIFG